MALSDSDFAQLGKNYKASTFVPGYPTHALTFYSPVDDVPSVLRAVARGATKSLVIAMYGFDDEDLVKIILDRLSKANVYVQLTLDKSQAGGVHERELLAKADFPANSIAIGNSEKHAIMHMKLMVVDGLDVVTGSTNWSVSGETKQDNQLTVIRDPYVAAEAIARISAIHATMLNETSHVGRMTQKIAREIMTPPSSES